MNLVAARVYGLMLAAPVCGGGSSYLDRTTLTRLPSGEVRQVIEASSDEGRNPTTGSDAVYRRRH